MRTIGMYHEPTSALAFGACCTKARAETVAMQLAYHEAFKTRRCTLSATGFNRRLKVGKDKQLFAIVPKNDAYNVRRMAYPASSERLRRADEAGSDPAHRRKCALARHARLAYRYLSRPRVQGPLG